MIGLAIQRKNLAGLMEIKPKIFLLGRNPLSSAPHQNQGVVLNRQGLGRHHPPGGAPYLHLIQWEVSEDQVVASLVARYIGARI